MITDHPYKFQRGVEMRWATAENPTGVRGGGGKANFGRKGSASVKLAPGAQHILAEATGSSGMVRRIWLTLADRTPYLLRGLRIDFYWDGAAKPAISAPLADFFAVCPSHMVAFQSALFSSPEGRSFNCIVPMPFRSGFRILVTNETDTPVRSLFYEVDYTLGDRHGTDMLYFHAHFNRENPTSLRQDYAFLPELHGRGRFLGVAATVRCNYGQYAKTWWGEGEIKCFIDGDTDYPTLVGTGTEDYIGTAWGQGCFAHLYQGSPVADRDDGVYSFYRYHIPDPIFFNQSIRVTMQQIGYVGVKSANYGPFRAIVQETGYQVMPAGKVCREYNLDQGGLFERQDDWASCAYFYLDQPVNQLADCPDLASRIKDLPDSK